MTDISFTVEDYTLFIWNIIAMIFVIFILYNIDEGFLQMKLSEYSIIEKKMGYIK